MKVQAMHQCQCEICQQASDSPTQALHHQMNVFMSRLDEQQRRWYAALEAKKFGHGGNTHMARITGLNVNTIRRGRRELAADLDGRPAERQRVPGGGRKRVEKKMASSSRP